MADQHADPGQHHDECSWLPGEDPSLCSCAGRGRTPSASPAPPSELLDALEHDARRWGLREFLARAWQHGHEAGQRMGQASPERSRRIEGCLRKVIALSEEFETPHGFCDAISEHIEAWEALLDEPAPFDHRSVGAGGGDEDDECSCEQPTPGRVRCMNCFNHIPRTGGALNKTSGGEATPNTGAGPVQAEGASSGQPLADRKPEESAVPLTANPIQKDDVVPICARLHERKTS